MEAKEIKEIEEAEEVKDRRRRAEYDESGQALSRRSHVMLAHRYRPCRDKVFQWSKGRVKRQKFEPGLQSRSSRQLEPERGWKERTTSSDQSDQTPKNGTERTHVRLYGTNMGHPVQNLIHHRRETAATRHRALLKSHGCGCSGFCAVGSGYFLRILQRPTSQAKNRKTTIGTEIMPAISEL